MAESKSGLLLSSWIMLHLTFYLTVSFSVDIMVNVNTSGQCLQPVICKQNISQMSRTWSIIFCPTDEFALGKSVRKIEGDLVLLTSLSPCGLNCISAPYADNANHNMCSFNCSAILKDQGHVYLHHVFPHTSRQSVFLTLSHYHSPLDTIAQDIKHLLLREKWKTFIIFASSHQELTVISTTIRDSVAKSLLFTMDQVEHLNDTMENIYHLSGREDLNFILICSAKCIVKLLDQAYHLETATGKTSRWLLVPTDSVKDVVNTSYQVPTTDIVVLDVVSCAKKYSSVSIESIQEAISSMYAANSSKQYEQFTNYLEKTLTRNNSIVRANVYSLHTSLNGTNIRHVGSINKGGIITLSDDLFPGAKYGFNMQTLTVSTLEWHPFVIKQEVNGIAKYSGICMDLLDELARTLNFTYKVIEPEDMEWGRILDGKWTGLVGQVAYKEVDLVAAPISMTVEREMVMDFSVPYFYVQSGIILKTEDPNANKWMTLVAPFRYEVHICILFSLIFSTFFLFVVEEVHPLNIWTDNRLSARRIRCGDILWYHFGALMANGGAYLPNSQTGRSVLSCWWFFTVISAAIYSGNLIAFLTAWREKLPFNTLAEMVEQDTHKWGTVGGTAYITLFENSKRPVYQKIWQGLQDPELVSTDLEVHKRKTLAGQYAYIGDETLTELWKLEDCNIQILNDSFFLMNYAIGLPNNSIYTSLFSEQILRINEIGLPRIWYKRWTSTVQCETARSAKRVDILALQSAFYAAGVGVFLALFVMLSEIMYNKKCREVTLSRNHADEDINADIISKL